jgi:hypothetical protein
VELILSSRYSAFGIKLLLDGRTNMTSLVAVLQTFVLEAKGKI